MANVLLRNSAQFTRRLFCFIASWLAAASGASLVSSAPAWGSLPRQSREQLEALMRSTDLGQQMKNFNVHEDWAAGKRGRH